MSIPANCKVDRIHLAIEDEVIRLQGQTYVRQEDFYFSVIASASDGPCPRQICCKRFLWTYVTSCLQERKEPVV